MADTTFVARVTSITSVWLQVVNNFIYRLTQTGTGAGPRTAASKIGENASITDFYANGSSGTMVDPTFVTDSTAGIQAAMTAFTEVHGPVGNFKLSSAISLVKYQQVLAAGRADVLYGSTPSGSNIAGTRFIQTGSAACFTTGAPASSANWTGRIKLENMVLQGANNTTVNGTSGVYCSGSQSLKLVGVQASFFLNAGFHVGACVDARIDDCYASYSQDAGLDLTYDTDYQPTSFNAYNALIVGGQYNQNKNANIRLGVSSFGVKILGVDIESAGDFYSTGTGYGLHVIGQAMACVSKYCWYEGNKIHAVLGTPATPSTVPVGFVFDSCHFGAVTGGAEKLRFETGRGTVVRNSNFSSGGSIYLSAYTDNPILENNAGNPTVTNADGDNIAYRNVADTANDFPTPSVAAWVLSNCTIALDTTVVSPGGVIPVYKVTPSATGLVSQTFVGSGIAPFAAGEHHTFGWWVKSATQTGRKMGWQISTSGGGGATYSDYTGVDRDGFTDEWQWFSFGRSVPSTATGNLQLALVVDDNTGTDAYYITAMQTKRGIINAPFPALTNGIAAPTTQTGATYSILPIDSGVIANRAGTVTITLEAAAANPGKRIDIQTIQAQTVVSASSNVVPQVGGAAGTAILPATDGAWAVLRSDGTNWQIVQSYP